MMALAESRRHKQGHRGAVAERTTSDYDRTAAGAAGKACRRRRGDPSWPAELEVKERKDRVDDATGAQL